jgi:hypothetical protein
MRTSDDSVSLYSPLNVMKFLSLTQERKFHVLSMLHTFTQLHLRRLIHVELLSALCDGLCRTGL